jgi:hypothetical protein
MDSILQRALQHKDGYYKILLPNVVLRTDIQPMVVVPMYGSIPLKNRGHPKSDRLDCQIVLMNVNKNTIYNITFKYAKK